MAKRPLEEPIEDRKTKITKTTKSKKTSPPTSTSPKPSPVLASMEPQLALIASSGRTAFEKRVWTLLCQIPKGHFSTYGIMAAHMNSSPRAVGNALRRNPFAPEVPCHRVVATGGALGGFKGKWPKDGEGITIDEKKKLLRGEGVRLDEKGKVLGTPFAGFV
ncbi:methylated-DNA-- -cysteine methyltransferase [Fusarium albosuccineum]|uniref:Methylated-DNA--protein-cysteine methyltransferase n=1 Tax=Fusarium albosuccineum TaxID=1237068 RepID=A0A8H4KEK6_9HYPO|nr:methylated-DNA-- -cysteine methyltransferase [Fusarium albosuccineum]